VTSASKPFPPPPPPPQIEKLVAAGLSIKGGGGGGRGGGGGAPAPKLCLGREALVAASRPENLCPPSRPTGFGVSVPAGQPPQDIARESPIQAAGGVGGAVRSSERQDAGRDAAGSDASGLYGTMPLAPEGKAEKEGRGEGWETLIQTSQRFRHPASQREQYMFEALRHLQTPISQDQNGIDAGREGGTRGHSGVGSKGADGHRGTVTGARSNSIGAQVQGALGRPSTRTFGYCPQREIVNSRVPHEQPALIQAQQTVIEQVNTSSTLVRRSNMAPRLPHSSSASVTARLPAVTFSSSSIEDDRGGESVQKTSVQKTLNDDKGRLLSSGGGKGGGDAEVPPARNVVPAREVGLGGGSGASMNVALASGLAETAPSNERRSQGSTLLPPRAPMLPPPPPLLFSLACKAPERGNGPTQGGKEKMQVYDMNATNVGHRCRPVSSGQITHSFGQGILRPQSALGQPMYVPKFVVSGDRETSRGIDKGGGVGGGRGHVHGAGAGDRAQMFFHSYGRPDTFARTPRNRSREQQQERERAIERVIERTGDGWVHGADQL
jgi:hypothetical protein